MLHERARQYVGDTVSGFLRMVLSILYFSSIHDQTGMMSSMIRKLKKHLNIVGKFGFGAIYSSHGFLSGRPYYSGLIENLKKGSDDGDDNIRVSSFEKMSSCIPDTERTFIYETFNSRKPFLWRGKV